jgi:diguanylate cyclase (GGDEF)-like protein
MKPFAKRIARFLPRLRKSSREDFAWRLFARNNLTLVILSGFLVIEQLCYALFVSISGSPLQCCYFVSALLVAIFFAVSLGWQRKKPSRLTLLHRSFPALLVFTGMAVALIRFIYIEFDLAVFRVPTLYIAVLYGCAVLFVISPWVNLVLYALLTVTAILVMPFVHPEAMGNFYVADLCSNASVAFMVSLLNYRAFVKHYTTSRAIEGKNTALVQKNQEIKRINQQLKQQSEQDELTQLFNRHKINQLLKQLEERYLETAENFSIILLDIDHFKKVNDNYGHSIGDRILKLLARTLYEHVREVDSCGRWGGEEFIIICPSANCVEIAPLAERLRQLFNANLYGDGLTVTASFGVACYSRAQSLTQLLQIADSCLYTAKSRGRNQVVLGSDENQLEMFPPLTANL